MGLASSCIPAVGSVAAVAIGGRPSGRSARRALVPPPHPAPPDVSQQGPPSVANWTAIDTIDIVDLIVGQGCTTILNIPQKCIQTIGQCQTLVYRACVPTDDDICYRGHTLEIILSATVLCDSRGGANGHRALINHAKRFLKGDWVAMWAERKIRVRYS